MAIPPHPSPTKKSPLSSKRKHTEALETKKRLLEEKATNHKPKAKKVNFNLPSNIIVSYEPKSATLGSPPDSLAKSVALDRATEVQASLPSDSPSFVKPMLPSHVTGGFWLGFPRKFCNLHMPKHDETVVLVDEDDREFNTKYLVDKTGLSGGWRGFSIAHGLLEGDALVFQMIKPWKFKVYIARVNGLNEIDGALGLLNLVPQGTNVLDFPSRTRSNGGEIQNGPNNLEKRDDTDADSRQESAQRKRLVVFDPSGNDVDSSVSDGLRFSQSVVEFKHVSGVEDFNIVVDDLVVDSEIPRHFRTKYYDLCRGQNTYLHENILKGLNLKLAVGVILETVTIADAVRACTAATTRDDLETWDTTLKAFEELGMKVGFLRDRIGKLTGLLFRSREALEAKRKERVEAEEEARVSEKRLLGAIEAVENLDAEIETLGLEGESLAAAFLKEANAPW